MTRLPAIFLLLSLTGLSGPAGAAPPAVRTWAELDDRDWSEAALGLRRGEAAAWTYLDGSDFTIAGASLRQLEQAAAEVDAARRYGTEVLGLGSAGARAIVLLVGSAAAWQALVDRFRLRSDGEALQVGREIFLRVTNGLPAGRVAHEMTHFLLRQPGAPRLPLWLDEGLAQRWGARALAEAGLGPAGGPGREAMPPALVPTLEAMAALRSYPDSAPATRAFYRLAEEAVDGLAAELGDRGLLALAREVAGRDGDWRAALATRAWTTEQLDRWAADARTRASRERISP